MADIILIGDEAAILTWLHERSAEYSKNSMFARSAILDKTEMTAENFQKAMSFLVHHNLAGQESQTMQDGTVDLAVWITGDGANVIRHHRRGRGEHS
ncbi:MAG: hypothetical protein K8U57_13890 [Planctomycetes bacterium]|nr:hypothetical protein [Planctomycetota bacterium]